MSRFFVIQEHENGDGAWQVFKASKCAWERVHELVRFAEQNPDQHGVIRMFECDGLVQIGSQIYKGKQHFMCKY